MRLDDQNGEVDDDDESEDDEEDESEDDNEEHYWFDCPWCKDIWLSENERDEHLYYCRKK